MNFLKLAKVEKIIGANYQYRFYSLSCFDGVGAFLALGRKPLVFSLYTFLEKAQEMKQPTEKDHKDKGRLKIIF